MKVGDIVKLNTGDGKQVPAMVTAEGEDGKLFVTAFPGPFKDDESLQAPACELEVGPGTGKYEVEA